MSSPPLAPEAEGRGRRRLLAVVATVVVAAIVVLAAFAWWLQASVTLPPPTVDVNPPGIYWRKDPTDPGSELVGAGPVVGLAFRVLPRSFEPRADRLYVAMPHRLYAIRTYGTTPPERGGLNDWGTLQYFNVSAPDGATNRTVTVSPVAMNYGDYINSHADYEVYLGSSDGRLFILRDRGNYVPTGDAVAVLNLTGAITGLAAYNGDLEAPGAIRGSPEHIYTTGSDWVEEPVPVSGDAGEYASLAVNASGRVTIAYYDYTSGRPFVSARTGSGPWSTLPLLEPYSMTGNVGTFTSVAVGSDGEPRVAYYDENLGRLKFAAWDGSLWNVTVVDAGPDVGRSASLRLTAADAPRIAYYNATARRLQYASWSGGSWSVEVPDASSNVTGEYASLALDAAGNPRIAYYDRTARTLRFVGKDGAGPWRVPETVDPSANDVGQFASLAVDGTTGRPHIAYYDATAKALGYATKTSAWSAVVVDDPTGRDVGRYAAIALGASGEPAIAYHDATDLDLKFAQFDGATWSARTVRSEGNTGLYNSLVFDSSGRPHIGSYAYETGRTAKDIVVAGTSLGRLYGIDVSVPKSIESSFREKRVASWDYRTRWTIQATGEVHLTDAPLMPLAPVPSFSPSFTTNGALVVAGLSGGGLLAVNTSTGSVAWQRAIAGTTWSSAPIVYEDVGSREPFVLAAGDDGRVSVFRADAGEPLGSRTVAASRLRTPAVAGAAAFAPASAGELYRINLAASPPETFLAGVWVDRLSGAPSGIVTPLGFRNSVLVADDAGRLHEIGVDGSVRYRIHLCDAITAGPVVWMSAGAVLGPAAWVGCRDGTIVAVET